MFLKQSLILLFVGTFASAIAADIEDYDIESLRKMLRSQSECPNQYIRYSANCSRLYEHGIQTCQNSAAASKSVLNKKSSEDQKVLLKRADGNCQDLLTCQKDTADKFYTCFANKSAISSAEMNSMQFEANSKQAQYLSEMSNINAAQTACTNETTYDLSINNAMGVNTLQDCFRTGIWNHFVLLPGFLLDPPVDSKKPIDTDESDEVSDVIAAPDASDAEHEHSHI